MKKLFLVISIALLIGSGCVSTQKPCVRNNSSFFAQERYKPRKNNRQKKAYSIEYSNKSKPFVKKTHAQRNK